MDNYKRIDELIEELKYCLRQLDGIERQFQIAKIKKILKEIKG